MKVWVVIWCNEEQDDDELIGVYDSHELAATASEAYLANKTWVRHQPVLEIYEAEVNA
jgi:hypothetical protein